MIHLHTNKHVGGSSPFARFAKAMRALAAVPKSELDEMLAKEKAAKLPREALHKLIDSGTKEEADQRMQRWGDG
jgi:hypothetical protein